MSARHAYYYSCDYCGHAESPKGNTFPEARTAATRAGWRELVVIGEDMCPDCIKVRSENARGIGRPNKPPRPEPEVIEEKFADPATEDEFVTLTYGGKPLVVTQEEINDQRPDFIQSARRMGLL